MKYAAKATVFALLGCTILAGAVSAGGGGGGNGGGGGPSTDLFNPPRVYITPGPNTLTFTPPDESGATGGIPYGFTVNLGQNDQAIFGFFVGALSWDQPGFTNYSPKAGWTHNSNWIALNLAKPTVLTIQVGPSVPIPCAGTTQPAACDATGRTGSDLYPAISLYKGQDTTTVASDPHEFNPTGKFWATVSYLDSSYQSDPKTHVLVYKKLLSPGQYTINIGGAAAISPDCNSTLPCYSGGKSYQAQITTSSGWE